MLNRDQIVDFLAEAVRRSPRREAARKRDIADAIRDSIRGRGKRKRVTMLDVHYESIPEWSSWAGGLAPRQGELAPGMRKRQFTG